MAKKQESVRIIFPEQIIDMVDAEYVYAYDNGDYSVKKNGTWQLFRDGKAIVKGAQDVMSYNNGDYEYKKNDKWKFMHGTVQDAPARQRYVVQQEKQRYLINSDKDVCVRQVAAIKEWINEQIQEGALMKKSVLVYLGTYIALSNEQIGLTKTRKVAYAAAYGVKEAGKKKGEHQNS